MAKKKKSHKKKSQYKTRKQSGASAPRSLESTRNNAPEVPVLAGQVKSSEQVKSKPSVDTPKSGEDVIARRARYEVRHSLLLAGAIMLGLVLLWCLFAYTSVGAQVYKLIRI